MPRITARDGNVIAADFRPPALNIEFATHILYMDEAVCLVRATFTVNGKPCSKLPPLHVAVDLPTN